MYVIFKWLNKRRSGINSGLLISIYLNINAFDYIFNIYKELQEENLFLHEFMYYCRKDLFGLH